MRFPPIRAYFLLGKTLKSHGTSGQLRIMIEDRLKTYAQEGAFLFLEHVGSKVPYRITEAEEGQHYVVRLEEVAGKQEADRLSGKEIWIPVDQVKLRHLKSPVNLREPWADYTIIHSSSGETFPILRTEEYPQQLMAIILSHGKEIMIPLHEQLIEAIDKEAKTILMEIPEGLFEL